MSAGAVMVGGAVSLAQGAWTLILWVQLAVRPTESETVQVIIVTPVGYGAFSGTTTAGVTITPFSSYTAGVLSLRTPVTVTPVAGVVVGVPGSTVAEPDPSSVADLSGGQDMVGGGVFVSVTVTVKVHESPESAFEVTMCVPTVKNEPEPGVLATAPQLPNGWAAG
jgi:hypothetical protein